ncbi:MAG TPA: hypothetical protein PLA68_11760, partial [Panacibacter sp.]|nr:hypothetical protein [Panacibacter sp.]
MSDNQNKPEIKSYHDQQIENANKAKEQLAKWKAEIESSESMQNYFKGFQPASVQSFINNYISKKSLWVNYGEHYKRKNEAEELQWETAAFKHLEYIQQKKLFDTQCLWRAEKITLPGVEICFDFRIWEQDILNCPFIEPVSEKDIDLYAQYLLQSNVDIDELQWFESWQDYTEIKEAYNTDNANRNFPEWYDFHNGRTGAGVLMLLPDTRGEKEKFYRHLYAESIKEERETKLAEYNATRDKRPYIREYEEGFMQWFVTTFESKDVQELYKSFTWGHRNDSMKERIEDNIRLLLTAEEHVPVESHYNWIEALEIAVEKFRCKKIAES